jgi:hypothetical protein
MTVAAALRTGAFWILAFITIFSAFSENGLVTNLSPILTQHGVLAALQLSLCRFVEEQELLAASVSASQSIASLRNSFSRLFSPWPLRAR